MQSLSRAKKSSNAKVGLDPYGATVSRSGRAARKRQVRGP